MTAAKKERRVEKNREGYKADYEELIKNTNRIQISSFVLAP